MKNAARLMIRFKHSSKNKGRKNQPVSEEIIIVANGELPILDGCLSKRERRKLLWGQMCALSVVGLTVIR